MEHRVRPLKKVTFFKVEKYLYVFRQRWYLNALNCKTTQAANSDSGGLVMSCYVQLVTQSDDNF